MAHDRNTEITTTVLPPQDLEAEQATLGAILVEPGAATIAMAVLEEGDFYPEGHRTIFRAMQTVHYQSNPVDLVTVSAELRRQDRLGQGPVRRGRRNGKPETHPTALSNHRRPTPQPRH